MEITDDIEQKIIEDNIARISARLEELQPTFLLNDTKEFDSLTAELNHWKSLRKEVVKHEPK
jgi:hypothetical protein